MTLRIRAKTAPIFLSVLLGLALQTSPSEAAGEPVAVLNGTAISRAEYGEYLIETIGRRPLRGLIARKLAVLEAERLNIRVEDATVHAAFEEIWSSLLVRWEGDEDKAQAELERQGFTRESYQTLVEGARRHELLIDGICRATRVVSQAAVRELFEKEYGRDGRLVEVRHIFLESSLVAAELRESTQTEPTPASLRAELDRRVTNLLTQLRDGGDFAALASAHSHDKRTAEFGGKLSAEAMTQLGEAFHSSVRSAAVGLPAGPAFTERGAHLIEVTSRVTTRFEDVRESLAKQLKEAPANYAEQGECETRLYEAARVEGL